MLLFVFAVYTFKVLATGSERVKVVFGIDFKFILGSIYIYFMIFGNLNTKGFKFNNIVLRSWSQAEDGETFAKSCFLPGRPPMLYESGLITGRHEI